MAMYMETLIMTSDDRVDSGAMITEASKHIVTISNMLNLKLQVSKTIHL